MIHRPELLLCVLSCIACSSQPATTEQPILELSVGPRPSATSSVAGVYEQGITAMRTAQDKAGVKRAGDFFERACNGGDWRGCVDLGELYERVDLPDFNQLERAVELYQRACSAGEGRGCTALGILYIDGNGVPKNRAKGVGLLRQACNMKAGGGCFNLMLIEANDDPKHNAELFKTACDGGLMIGCLNLGEAYEKGEGVPRDERRANELITRACSDSEPPDTCKEIMERRAKR